MVSAEHTTLRSPPRGTSKVRLAVLDAGTAAQLESSLDSGSDLELAWAGTSATDLLSDPPAVQVVLANIDHLDGDPVANMNAIVEATGAELGIALYAYAKRELLDRMASPRVRTLRSPLNIPMLRCQMMGIIARNLLNSNSNSNSSASSSASVSRSAIVPPRYSAVQLGKLQQISTAIDCECPNQLATLLQNLADFEAYSANCESRNPEDAEVHRLLYEHTARARALMERAMDRLVEHEQLEI
jgi:hypothetical protein